MSGAWSSMGVRTLHSKTNRSVDINFQHEFPGRQPAYLESSEEESSEVLASLGIPFDHCLTLSSNPDNGICRVDGMSSGRHLIGLGCRVGSSRFKMSS